MEKDDQVLKSRDDKAPVKIARISDGVGESFQLAEGSTCSWASSQEKFTVAKLRERIEPWLTALFQSEHFALLAGSGLPHAVHSIATGQLLPGMAPADFSEFNFQIKAAAEESAMRAARNKGNIEDQIRVANELLRGLGTC